MESSTSKRTFPFLKARLQIGSSRFKKTVYPLQEKVFHQKDVPEKARRCRQEVLESTRCDLLGLCKPDWNTSVDAGEKLCIRRHRQIPIHDPQLFKHNYRAETLPEPASVFQVSLGRTTKTLFKSLRAARTQEMPVHPALEGNSRWKLEQTLSQPERTKWFRDGERARTANTRRTLKRMLDYTSPVERERRYMQTLRQQRKFPAKFQHQQEASSEASEDLVTEDGRKIGQLLLPTTVNRRYRQFSHTGKYGFSEVAGREVWSCCMGETPDARGCVTTVHNPDAYNFVSPFSE